MANSEHLDVLRHGTEVWNQWRLTQEDVQPDLVQADCRDADLTYANLRGADLTRANLPGAKLINADLSGANLVRAYLNRSVLTGANLSEANFTRANLRGADLRQANLTRAKLDSTDVQEADFSGANFSSADLTRAIAGRTIFGDVDLSSCHGLETVRHYGPSTLGVQALVISRGEVPEEFLRGVGIAETFITYTRSSTGRATEFYSCFLSYSSRDQHFADRLYTDLQAKGVRCWFAPEEMKAGDKIRTRIEESIGLHEKLLLVLSKHSIVSAWVEREVETAFDYEQRRGALVLFPVRLDNEVMQTNEAWAADLRRMRHIGDFSHWNDHAAYQKAFDRLLRDLTKN